MVYHLIFLQKCPKDYGSLLKQFKLVKNKDLNQIYSTTASSATNGRKSDQIFIIAKKNTSLVPLYIT